MRSAEETKKADEQCREEREKKEATRSSAVTGLGIGYWVLGIGIGIGIGYWVGLTIHT